MTNQVGLIFRSVYGKDLCYPANQTAETFASMLNKKTFDVRDLRHMRALGFKTCELDRFGNIVGEILDAPTRRVA